MSNSCNWTGHVLSTAAENREEMVERTRSAIEATRVNLVAYQQRPDASVHVIGEALHRLAILHLQLRVRLWALRLARGY